MIESKLSVVACLMLLIVVLHEVTCRSAINARDYRRQNRDLTLDEEDEDVDDYPFEAILNLVRETKEFLKSPNITDEERKKLDIDPGFYDNYLNGDYSDLPTVISIDESTTTSTTNVPSHGINLLGYPQTPSDIYDISNIGGSSSSSSSGSSSSSSSSGGIAMYPVKRSCQAQHRVIKPKKMRSIDGKDYYIVNVGRDFMQRIKIVVCQYPGMECNNAITWPENHNYHCQQDYGATRDLFSVPLDKPRDMWQQKRRSFQIPNKCQCQMSRQTLD